MIYRVTAQVLTHDGAWHGSKSVPTFLLDSDVQGFLDCEGAAVIAREVINPLGTMNDEDIELCIMPAYAADEMPAGRHVRAS